MNQRVMQRSHEATHGHSIAKQLSRNSIGPGTMQLAQNDVHLVAAADNLLLSPQVSPSNASPPYRGVPWQVL